METFDIQMNGIILEYLAGFINFIKSDAFFDTLSAILGMISFLQEFLEHYREKAWRKILTEAIILLVFLAILRKIDHWAAALCVMSLFVLTWTFQRRIKQSRQIKENINAKQDEKSNDLLVDATEEDYVPRILEFSMSPLKNAELCLAERPPRPREAIRYLNNCRERERQQGRFTTHYADALIMLDNYQGALAKLNSLSDKQLKKKKRYKNVMVRKAACYYGLNKYVEELDCYDKIIASNYKLGKYYFYRGKIKVRLLEIHPYMKAAEQVVCQEEGSRQDFIMSAMADLDKALSYGDEDKAKILSYRGSCYFYLSEYQKVLDCLYESQELRNDLANNYVYFGLYYYEKEDFNAAETYLERAISCHAENEVPYLYLAKINYKNGMYDQAISYAASALSILPSIDESHYIQGKCYAKKSMYAEAITCYTRAIEWKPKEEYFQERALCYYNKAGGAEYRKAYEDTLKAIALNDTDYNRINAMLYKAEMDYREGHAMGLDELKRLVQPYAEQPRDYNRLGIIFYKYGYLKEAEEYYRKAIENDANDDVPRYNLALLFKDTGNLEEAAEQLKEAIALNPLDMKYFTVLEECYESLGDTYNEIETHKKIRRLKKQYMTVNRKNGDAVYRVGKYCEAENYYRLALRYAADDSATLNNLACALYYQERYEEAIQTLEKVIAETKEYYLAYFNLGNCYLRIGKTKENQNLARESYRMAQQLSTGFEPAGQMLETMSPSDIEMKVDVLQDKHMNE